MSHRKLLVTAALGIASAVVIAACGGSSSPSSSGSKSVAGLAPKAALIQAASNTGSQAGEKLQVTADVTSTEGHFAITGTGAFNKSPQEGTLQMNMSGLPTVGSVSLNMVIAKSVIYIKIPASLLSKLPAAEAGEFGAFLHGKSWVELDTKSLSHLGSGLGSLAGSSSSFNKGAYLKLLQSATSISKVGSATVNGVATTEYRATINPAKLPSAATAAKSLPSAIPVTVWIDGSGLVRQLSVTVSSVAGSSFAVTLDFLSYGLQAAPAIPSASETDNLSSLLGNLASSGASGL
jgi:hypothetical protein